MSLLEVRLFGQPTVLVDGVVAAPPKGAKPWGLLAYLTSSPRSHPRSELAELLFSQAADPLGALRWNLAALRRLLDRPDELKGEVLALPLVDATIDTRRLDAGELPEPSTGAGGHDLLAGVSFDDSPLFEVWLTGERSRLRMRRASLLREAVLGLLASGDAGRASGLASQLVSIDPLDEGHHALLIRARVAAGDRDGARRHFDQCRDLLDKELGAVPGPAVIAAANLAAATRVASAVEPHVVEARMTVAWQSFLCGSVDHAVDLGRSVVALSDQDDEVLLQVTARLFLAGMLAIAVRGWDETAMLTTEALHLAEQASLPFEAAMARGILAGNDLMRADYASTARHAEAGASGCSEPGALAFNLIFLAAAEADTERAGPAIEHAVAAVHLAEETADPLRLAYTHAYAAHAFLLAADPTSARPHVERAVDVTTAMLVLHPWPLAMLAEIEAGAGHLDRAADHAARAAAISSTTDVAYQRGLALRAVAIVENARGNPTTAVDHLTHPLFHARRTTGEGYSFHWPVAWILDTLAQVCRDTDPAAATRWANTLLDHATSIGMSTFINRANAHLRP